MIKIILCYLSLLLGFGIIYIGNGYLSFLVFMMWCLVWWYAWKQLDDSSSEGYAAYCALEERGIL